MKDVSRFQFAASVHRGPSAIVWHVPVAMRNWRITLCGRMSELCLHHLRLGSDTVPCDLGEGVSQASGDVLTFERGTLAASNVNVNGVERFLLDIACPEKLETVTIVMGTGFRRELAPSETMVLSLSSTSIEPLLLIITLTGYEP